MRATAVIAIILLGAAVSVGRAADGHGAEVANACKGDIARLCPNVQKGGGRILQCLRQNASQLSDGCRDTLRQAAGEMREGGAMEWMRACRDDIPTLCQGVEPGDGRIVACLRQNSGRVSAGCKAALPQ
ncbi:MAG: cysteine rich repeat-containing protein [Deltaproteobacteria bacterium]|nr:cysteine rich repeat-containing protein [Deltaproteobacteria bacterium]